MHVCLLVPCGRPLGGVSFVMSSCDVVTSHWYPGSGVLIPDLCPISYFEIQNFGLLGFPQGVPETAQILSGLILTYKWPKCSECVLCDNS